MPRILYVCPDNNAPIGGIKVIYRHVELLRQLGHDAHVMHFRPEFGRCTWFANDAPVRYLSDLNGADIAVVPDFMSTFANQLRGVGIAYAMFVQNGYQVLRDASFEAVHDCFKHAVAVMSISDDTSSLLQSVLPEFADKVMRVQYAIDTQRFRPGAKARKATYMPRKLPEHAANVTKWLAHLFPDWQFTPLHGMPEQQVAAELASSRVFLAFSDFEGCPVPPIEAAVSGNVVLGYPGAGGNEYWDEPNVRHVEMSNVRDFVRKFYEVAAFALRDDIDRLLAPGIRRLQQRYSPEREAELLQAAMARICGAPACAAAAAVPHSVQN